LRRELRQVRGKLKTFEEKTTPKRRTELHQRGGGLKLTTDQLKEERLLGDHNCSVSNQCTTEKRIEALSARSFKME